LIVGSWIHESSYNFNDFIFYIFMTLFQHPILQESFAIIDREIGEHNFFPAEYAIIRRVIHSTADFDFVNLISFDHDAINSAIAALRQQVPIITDVNMVKYGIRSLVKQSFNNPLISAIDQVDLAAEGKTRTETGLIKCFAENPQGIYVIGNAPTALLALCDLVQSSTIKPALIVGAPVGFVSVVESKNALATLSIPQIIVNGRKGGSPVAAAIINALIMLAYQS
jgi:precorrin-8X/cobalt-precorrin-8 methylmutase